MVGFIWFVWWNSFYIMSFNWGSNLKVIGIKVFFVGVYVGGFVWWSRLNIIGWF